MNDLKQWSGIIGQITGLVSVLILYFTYASQKDANESQRKHAVYVYAREDVQALRDQIEALRYHAVRLKEDDRLTVVYEGRAAIEEFMDDLAMLDSHDSILTHPFVDDLYFTIGRVDELLKRLSDAEMPDGVQNNAQRDLCFLYSNKLLLGMSRLLAMEQNDHLRITVSRGEMNRAVQLSMMLDLHRRMVDVIGRVGV